MGRGHQRRDEILAAMLAMCGEQGPDRVTTRGLAARVGVTEPALYRHFPEGKSQMWRALAEKAGERMQCAWRQALSGCGSGAGERLHALVMAQLRTIAETPALPAILFSRTLHRDNAALRAGVGEIGGRFHARLEQIIAEGQAGGELVSGPDPEAAAWMLVSVIQGTAVRWSLSDCAFDLPAEGARVLDVALDGLCRAANAGENSQ